MMGMKQAATVGWPIMVAFLCCVVTVIMISAMSRSTPAVSDASCTHEPEVSADVDVIDDQGRHLLTWEARFHYEAEQLVMKIMREAQAHKVNMAVGATYQGCRPGGIRRARRRTTRRAGRLRRSVH
jgi:hypothetical protein